MQDTIAFAPPLVVTETEIDEILARFGGALKETQDWAVRERLLA